MTSTYAAEASSKKLRVSCKKLHSIVAPLRNKPLGEVFRILQGMRKRSAVDVYKVVHSAMANAENNFGLDGDNLWLGEISVGKSFVLRRVKFCGRSRMGRVRKEFSQIRVVLNQYVEEKVSDVVEVTPVQPVKQKKEKENGTKI